jgi:hypothetical protein
VNADRACDRQHRAGSHLVTAGAWREPPLRKILAVPDENSSGECAMTNVDPGVAL